MLCMASLTKVSPQQEALAIQVANMTDVPISKLHIQYIKVFLNKYITTHLFKRYHVYCGGLFWFDCMLRH